MLHRRYAKGMNLIVLTDRDIFAKLELLVFQMISRLVVLVAADVVVERPRSTGTMDQMAYGLVFIGPEAHHAAKIAERPP